MSVADLRGQSPPLDSLSDADALPCRCGLKDACRLHDCKTLLGCMPCLPNDKDSCDWVVDLLQLGMVKISTCVMSCRLYVVEGA